MSAFEKRHRPRQDPIRKGSTLHIVCDQEPSAGRLGAAQRRGKHAAQVLVGVTQDNRFTYGHPQEGLVPEGAALDGNVTCKGCDNHAVGAACPSASRQREFRVSERL
jgi:hypothetical protein